MSVTSYFLTSYLLSINAQMVENVPPNLSEALTEVIINHQNTDINFSYQHWHIDKNSVCLNIKNEFRQYSTCTFRAKSLFSEICKTLTQQQSEDSIQKHYKTMYCDATQSYMPASAPSTPIEQQAIDENEKQCNLLILRAMSTQDAAIFEEKNRVCSLVNQAK